MNSNTEVKNLESCYKIQRKFYISEQSNKDTEKNIYDTKTLTYTFHYCGAFVWGLMSSIIHIIIYI